MHAEQCPACGYEMYVGYLTETPAGTHMTVCKSCSDAWTEITQHSEADK